VIVPSVGIPLASPRGSIESLEGFRKDWLRAWLLEFACDIFATYCVGPAYGWCNVRLCAKQSPDIVADSRSHPADEARTRTIDKTLLAAGYSSEAAEIRSAWDELVTLTGKLPPQQFELAYLPSLLDAVVKHIMTNLAHLGIRPHVQSKDSDVSHMTSLLNEAWRRFRAGPTDYPSWEATQAARLRDFL
jgi:hypothetical protein